MKGPSGHRDRYRCAGIQPGGFGDGQGDRAVGERWSYWAEVRHDLYQECPPRSEHRDPLHPVVGCHDRPVVPVGRADDVATEAPQRLANVSRDKLREAAVRSLGSPGDRRQFRDAVAHDLRQACQGEPVGPVSQRRSAHSQVPAERAGRVAGTVGQGCGVTRRPLQRSCRARFGDQAVRSTGTDQRRSGRHLVVGDRHPVV